jgi:hypothetical protein
MSRVLITGMSGTGKSAVIDELVTRGFRAIDADEGWSESGPEGDWIWIETRIQRLLSDEPSDDLFLSGCASNQGKFYPQFSHIILLSAPVDLIMQRLADRTNNTFGDSPTNACVCFRTFPQSNHYYGRHPAARSTRAFPSMRSSRRCCVSPGWQAPALLTELLRFVALESRFPAINRRSRWR